MLFVLSWVWPRVVEAEEQYRVLVLTPVAPTALERELMTRLNGELGAAGFEVLSLPLIGSDAERAVVSQGSELRPVAAFAMADRVPAGASPGAGSTLRLWLSDRVAGKLLLEEGQALDGSPAARLLAVRGVELLEARVADRRLPPQTAPPPLAPPPRAARPKTAARGPSELMTTLDLGVLFDAPSGGAALSPMFRLSYTARTSEASGGGVALGARLNVAALGAPTVLRALERRIDVVQRFALLDAIIVLNPDGVLRPFAALGAGVYGVHVQGVGPAPAIGRSEGTSSPVAAAGIGVAAHPLQHLVGRIEAQGLLAFPPTAVELEAIRVATFGRPLLVFSIGLGIVF